MSSVACSGSLGLHGSTESLGATTIPWLALKGTAITRGQPPQVIAHRTRTDESDTMNTDSATAPPLTNRRSVLISIRRYGAWTRIVLPEGVAGAHLRCLFDTAFRVEKVTASETRTNVPLKRETQRLAADRDGPLTLPAGYEPLVVQLAERVGVPYAFAGERPPPLLMPQPVCVKGSDRPLLDAVAANERLVVRVGPTVDVAEQITLLCRPFSAQRIVTLVKRVEHARRVVRHIRDAGVGVSLFTGQDTDDRTFERVAVATYRHAGDGRVGLWDADLLIVHDAADALGVDGREAIRLAHRDHPTAPRVVGFASVGFKPALNQYANMLSLYGTAEVTVPAPGVVNRAVEYTLLPVAGMNSHTNGGSRPDTIGGVKSARVWLNPIRNRLVAKLAGGLARGDGGAVSNRFPELAGHPFVGRRADVLVVVENDVHALDLLHGPLRGWFAVGPDIGRTSQPTGWGQVPRRLSPAVCTFAGLADVNVAGYDVVVRADAGAGRLPLAADSLYTATAGLPLLLIDLDDFRDPVLSPSAGRRREAYRAAGWQPVGAARRPRELDRFLESHPQGLSVRRRITTVARRLSNLDQPV